MQCPFCNRDDTQVKDSRTSSDGNTIKRRRVCQGCNAKFTTFERREVRAINVVKSDNNLQPFDINKLRKSLEIATRKRGVTADQIDTIINNVVLHLDKTGETTIPAVEIGKLVIENLATIDTVSYVRYASVYKDFTEVKDFEQFIKSNKLVGNG